MAASTTSKTAFSDDVVGPCASIVNSVTSSAKEIEGGTSSPLKRMPKESAWAEFPGPTSVTKFRVVVPSKLALTLLNVIV